MNTHNTINKQREKILFSGVAAAALGLINAKPQTVKAASQNGTRTTKKTARRAVKTKLNYQSDMTKTSAEAVTNDENSGNQSNNVGAVNSNLETGQHQASVVNNNNSILTETNQDEAAVNEKTDEQETDPIKFVAAKASRESNTSVSSTWNDIPVSFNNGVLSIGEKDKDYSIDNTAEKEIGINNNINNINTDNINEIDILGKITINGPADSLFDTLPNLTQINGLNNLITSDVTDMSYMFANCPKLVSLDLSSFDTSKVTFFSSMFYADTDLSSVNLSSFTITDDAVDYSLFDSCTNLTKLVLGKGIKFTTTNDLPNDSLQQPGTWVNMGEGNSSLTKGTNQWSSADLMTNYQGDRDHDTYIRYTGGTVTVHRQDEQGKQLVDQDGKQIPDEELFGNISDPINVDTNITGYTLKENKNPDVKAFTSDPQDITLVYIPSPVAAQPVTVYYKYRANNGELVEIPGSDPENFPKDATQSIVGKTAQIPFKSIDGYTPVSYQINNGDIIKSTNVPGVTLTAKPQSVNLIYTKTTTTTGGNSTPNSSVPNNNPSGNNGSVNNPSSSNSQGSNSQGSNTGNSNNNSSSGSNSQNNGNNLPNNEPHNIPSPANRKPKTVRPHKTINKGFNIKDQNAIHNQQLANSSKNNGSSSNAQNNASNTLPQTGNDKHNSLAMLALGSLALATAIGAAWFGRKKD